MISNKLTLDRKNNNKPYTIKNIALACCRCNYIKSNLFTYKEMIKLAKEFICVKFANPKYQ